tara:strand:- start:25 stop:1194 length:1170 start_codon:yes stop_codon:yes gene_type:complete
MTLTFIDGISIDINWWLHGTLLAINICLFVFAKPIIGKFHEGKDQVPQIKVFRAFNILFFFVHAFDIIMIKLHPDYENILLNMGYSLLAVYASMFSFQVVSYLSRKRFGDKKSLDGSVTYQDTYHSRLMDIAAGVLLLVSTLYILIVIWDLKSVLETTGFLGIVAGIIVLTNQIWAPDIYNGMMILNSKMLDDGDVITIEGETDEFIINKVNFVYTVLFNIRNNQRVLMRNSQLFNGRIGNLSKMGSRDGIRMRWDLNIGYLSWQGKTPADREKEYSQYRNRIRAYVDAVQKATFDDSECKVNKNREFEHNITLAGDYAVTVSIFFYIEEVPKTRITRTARQYLAKTPFLVMEQFNKYAAIHDLPLSTPQLVDYAHRSNDVQEVYVEKQ